MDGKALAAIGVGSLFLWSGIKGWSVLGTVGDIVSGRKPSQAETYPLSNPGVEGVGTGELHEMPGGGSAGGVVGGAIGGGSIVSTAMGYVGHAYRFGGAPGPSAASAWDCSSFINYVCGVKHGMAIPGYKAGTYKGTTHGPATGQWAIWNGLRNVKRSEVQAGDIIVWVGHMGMAISNSQMVNALNPKEGTKVTSIEGQASGPIVRCGRFV